MVMIWYDVVLSLEPKRAFIDVHVRFSHGPRSVVGAFLVKIWLRICVEVKQHLRLVTEHVARNSPKLPLNLHRQLQLLVDFHRQEMQQLQQNLTFNSSKMHWPYMVWSGCSNWQRTSCAVANDHSDFFELIGYYCIIFDAMQLKTSRIMSSGSLVWLSNVV